VMPTLSIIRQISDSRDHFDPNTPAPRPSFVLD
jgi:hypothetical protein